MSNQRGTCERQRELIRKGMGAASCSFLMLALQIVKGNFKQKKTKKTCIFTNVQCDGVSENVC